MLSEKMNEFIEEEINNRISDIKTQLDITTKELEKLKKKYNKIVSENLDLKDLQDQIDTFKVFKNLVTNDNFEQIIFYFNLKNTGIDISGMNTEKLPLWFKLLVKHYDDKVKLFSLMDLFNVNYPDFAKQIKLPYDYNEEELDLIFNNLKKMYVCNGQIYDYNIGFWYDEFYNHGINKFDIKKVFKSSSYVDIPWQLLLKNPLLVTEKYFNKIIESLKKKIEHAHYFYRIQEYQTITEEQARQMADHLPNTLWDVHKRFIENNKNILKTHPVFVEKYISNINDNHYSPFYYLNYPVDVQKDYIRKYRGYETKLNLIKKMDISKEEKTAFLVEIAEIELGIAS